MIVPPTPPGIIQWGWFFLVIPFLLVLILFWLIGLICAKKAERATGTKPTKWLFLVATLFLGMVVYIALADLARIGSRYYLNDQDWTTYSYDQFIKSLSARMVIILLGFPLLAGAWYKATGQAADPKQAESEALARKYLLSFEAVVLGLIIVLSFGVCLYHLFNWVLGVSELDWADLSPALGYGGVALAFLAGKLYWLTKSL